jgi:hypothetical protein
MRLFLFFTCILFISPFRAQEGLRRLQGNPAYIYAPPAHRLTAPSPEKAKASGTSLFIPFKEDFYYAPLYNYPTQRLWTDSSVYVNVGFGRTPLSIGVATFDGLNKHGYPYQPNLANMLSSNPSDTLTSQPINLFVTASSQTLLPTSNVGISFYYQPQGNGDFTEANDSLILDFYNPTQGKWVSRVWYKKGNSPADSIFRRGFVWIRNPDYLKDGFQFRFRNTATNAGDFDHWNLDYIYLDQGRDSVVETNYDDIAFSHVPSPFLKDYSTMPYNQYVFSEMDTMISVRIRNNSQAADPINMQYAHYLYDTAHVLLDQYQGGPDQLQSFSVIGYSKINAHRRPRIKYTFKLMTDSTDLEVYHILSRTSTSVTQDFFPNNDTLVQKQNFRNYFAFDDGSAEAGYYIVGNKGKVAQRIRLNKTDTLRALRIYFDPVGSLSTAQNYQFRICVWKDNSGAPGTLILRDSAMKQSYLSTGFRSVPEYALTSPMVLETGTYFIGIEQQVDKSLTIGFDRNYDFHNFLYFNSGTGWKPSTIPGSLMIHSVFGKYVPPPLSIHKDFRLPLLQVYPNPASSELHIRVDRLSATAFAIYDLFGRKVMEQPMYETFVTVPTQDLATGVYVLVLTNNGQAVRREKIVIEH